MSGRQRWPRHLGGCWRGFFTRRIRPSALFLATTFLFVIYDVVTLQRESTLRHNVIRHSEQPWERPLKWFLQRTELIRGVPCPATTTLSKRFQ
jgi:hypothetical protein